MSTFNWYIYFYLQHPPAPSASIYHDESFVKTRPVSPIYSMPSWNENGSDDAEKRRYSPTSIYYISVIFYKYCSSKLLLLLHTWPTAKLTFKCKKIAKNSLFLFNCHWQYLKINDNFWQFFFNVKFLAIFWHSNGNFQEGQVCTT